MLIIQKDAVFIADAHHHSLYQNTLDSILRELLESQSRQIFLIGDIFDFLVGGVEASINDNAGTLKLLEQLSLKHTVYYLEGNHDFLLSEIPYFKNIHCIPLESQPLCCQFNGKEAYLAHGDIFLNWHYKLFATLLRQKYCIMFLNVFSRILYPKIIRYLQIKNAKKRKNSQDSTFDFVNFAQMRIAKYLKKFPISSDSYIIEGHFHLGEVAKIQGINYVALPFFACKKRYFIVECGDKCLSLKGVLKCQALKKMIP